MSPSEAIRFFSIMSLQYIIMDLNEADKYAARNGEQGPVDDIICRNALRHCGSSLRSVVAI
jgi:hypothetical protein